MQLGAETGAVIEQMSIDEAYLDLSGLCQAEDTLRRRQIARLGRSGAKTIQSSRCISQRIRSTCEPWPLSSGTPR